MVALAFGRLTTRNLRCHLRPITTSKLKTRQISTYNIDIAGLTEEQVEVCQSIKAYSPQQEQELKQCISVP
jgi:isovaleryl-CoA dehydrogenase